MQMYNLIGYSNNYSKTLGNLWQNYRDEQSLTDAGAITNFYVDDNNDATNCRKDVEIKKISK